VASLNRKEKAVKDDDDLDDWKVTMPKAFQAIREDAKEKNRKQGTIVCPKCGGELGYSISSYNGHIHGQCNTTRGCLSWMI
jgi:hypothetical protein